MIREVYLEPTVEVSNSTLGLGQVGIGPDTDTPTLLVAVTDDLNTTYWYTNPKKDYGGGGRLLMTFQAPPTLVSFNEVKLQAWISYSQQGPNNWKFPPSNDYGPRVRMLLRNRAKSANLNDTTNEGWLEFGDGCTHGDFTVHNDNINNPADGKYDTNGPHLLEWAMTDHPEGGPFTIDDLSVANFVAGFEASAHGTGAANSCYDTSQGGFYRIRVHKLRVVLTVEDLGGYVSNVRNASSMILRMMRRARNTISVQTFAHQSVGAVGSRVYLSHPKGPALGANGWGRRRLERREGMIVARSIQPESFQIEDTVFDLRPYLCLGWGAYRIDGPWSPELQGMALLDKGGGYTHTRAQDGWSQRPGDGVAMRVIQDYPNISYRGLAAQAGNDTEKCLRNYDMSISPWVTVLDSGGFTATQDTTVSLVEEQGYLSSCKFTYSSGTGGKEQNIGTLAAGKVQIRIGIKNTIVPDPETQCGEWWFRTGTTYWNEAQREWVGAAFYNAIPSDTPYGEVLATDIPITGGTSYVIGVGKASSSLSGVTLHAGLVNCQYTAEADALSGVRTPLITLDSTITRTKDLHHLTNSSSAELWDYDQGTAIVEIQPFWDAADLPNENVKPLLFAYHASGTYDRLSFIAKSGSFDQIRFERYVQGETTYELNSSLGSGMVGYNVSSNVVLRAWVRWLGAEGWNEYAPYSVEVGWATFDLDGTYDHSGSTVGTLSYTGAVTSRDYLAIGDDGEAHQVDAYIRMWEVRRSPLSGVECIWRV